MQVARLSRVERDQVDVARRRPCLLAAQSGLPGSWYRRQIALSTEHCERVRVAITVVDTWQGADSTPTISACVCGAHASSMVDVMVRRADLR